MRAFGGIALVACCLLTTNHAAAKPVGGRRLGVGVGVGEPTALTGYLSLAESFALDAALGVASLDERDLAGHVDALLLFGGDATQHTAGAVYVGAGAFCIKFYDELFAGARFPFGATLLVPDVRLQLFAEIALELLLARPYDTPRNTELQASLGIRLFL